MTEPIQRTLVIVGCGAAKDDYPQRARDLYTSTYFQKKREYAEVVGDEWQILSAEHGLIDPWEPIVPYETSIDDLDDTALDELAHDVGMGLINWESNTRGITNVEPSEIIVLAGRKYIDPLKEREAFHAGISATVTFPLQQHGLGGIGEQMAWLKDRVEAESAEQAQLVTDGAGYVWDDEPCPEDECEGDLEQEDKFNVMCLSCETVFTHYRRGSFNWLETDDGQSVATKKRAQISGGETA